MIRRPPRSRRTDKLIPDTTLVRSGAGKAAAVRRAELGAMGGAEDVAAVGADEAALAVEAAPVQRRALVRAGIHVGEGMVAVAHHEQRDLLRACAEDKATTLAIGNLGEAAERRAGEGMNHGERRSGAIDRKS